MPPHSATSLVRARSLRYRLVLSSVHNSNNALGEDHTMATYNRRTLLGGVPAATAGALGSRLMAPAVARAQGAALGDSVKALVFDVFGTVVDWRNGVVREART